MSGRGRGRGFGRGQLFPTSDPANAVPIEKIQSARATATYPPHDKLPASLVTNSDYDEMNEFHNQFKSYFQSSNYYLKEEDESARLFASCGEEQIAKKSSLNFDWDLFPAELRPVGKKRLKEENVSSSSQRENKPVTMDLSLFDRLDKLAAIEDKQPALSLDIVKEEPVKDEPEIPDEDVEEFDDDEMDAETDYISSYFDPGEGYLDEDDDMDEPCY